MEIVASRTVIITSRAALDLEEICLYFRLNTPSMEDRFVTAVQKTIDQVKKMPTLGSTVDMESGTLEAVSFSTIKSFRKHLLFYRDLGSCIEIVRVLHSARDWEQLLDKSE